MSHRIVPEGALVGHVTQQLPGTVPAAQGTSTQDGNRYLKLAGVEQVTRPHQPRETL